MQAPVNHPESTASTNGTVSPLRSPPVKGEDTGKIRVSLRLSRGTTTPADSFEVAADITNTSSDPVYLNPMAIAMVPPPELDPQSPREWHPLIPGGLSNFCAGDSSCNESVAKGEAESSIHKAADQLADCYNSIWKWNFFHHSNECVQKQQLKDLLEAPDLYNKLVVLMPGSTTTAYWNGFTRSQQKGFLRDAISQFFVPPGAYASTVTVGSWSKEIDAQRLAENRDSSSEIIDITMIAAQTTVIIGSIIGGLFAFVLLPDTRFYAPEAIAAMAHWQRRAYMYVVNVLASFCLSTIVTIMLSRLANSQFIIKVSVNDFWGAIAIGFVVSASGKAVLKKFA